MWDAVEHYWKGYEWDGPNPEQPDYDEPGKSDKNPKDKNDPRWCSEVAPYADPTGAAPAVAATRSCKDCPNINELLWYIQQGLIWADSPELFSVMNSRYAGRYRIRKLSAIAKSVGKTVEELKAKAPDGVDYTRSTKMPNHFMMSNALASGSVGRYDKWMTYFPPPCYGSIWPIKTGGLQIPQLYIRVGKKSLLLVEYADSRTSRSGILPGNGKGVRKPLQCRGHYDRSQIWTQRDVADRPLRKLRTRRDAQVDPARKTVSYR